MRIIKKGDLEPRVFNCDNCGCIFEANNKEYHYKKQCVFPDYVDIYYCECPQCESEVEVREWREDAEENRF